MKFIDVVSKFTFTNCPFDPIPYSIDQSNGILISLNKDTKKEDLSKKRFDHTPKKIKSFKEKNIVSKQINPSIKSAIWVDSGGYDVLANRVMDEHDLDAYIEYYANYLEKYNTDFDYIFSLDFSLSPKKNIWFNKKRNLIDFNEKSISRTVDILRKDQDLQGKFYFVYQFKTKALFDIWQGLYDKFNLSEIIQNRAIGGLVSLNNLSKPKTTSLSGKISFSPVIGPAFNCFKDYYFSDKNDLDFKLHFLGVSNPVDRFSIALLEKYFARFLKIKNFHTEVVFSYDTRTYSTVANHRMNKIGVYHFDRDNTDRYQFKIRIDPDLLMVEKAKLKDIYFDNTEGIWDIIQNNMLWDKRVPCTDVFYPLVIYSNRNMDHYFEYFIEEHQIVDIIFNAKTTEDVCCRLDEIFEYLAPLNEFKILSATDKSDLPYFENKRLRNERNSLYSLFSEDLRQRIIDSCKRIFSFHNVLWEKDMDPKFVKNLMYSFIKDIGIKDKLARN